MAVTAIATSWAHAITKFPPPTQLQVTYPREWDTQSGGLADAALKDGAYGLLASVAAGTAGNLGGGIGAVVREAKSFGINPRNIVIFNDLPFRTITLGWSLKPASRALAKQWEDAIQQLKAYSAPILEEGNAVFYVEHCFFDVEIKSAAGTLFKSPECVIRSVEINYTPSNFWSQHQDGRPTNIEFSIEIAETTLATFQKLISGEMA